MTEIEIEKGIPMPTVHGEGRSKYPIAAMQVGDSFFIPGKNFRVSTLTKQYRDKDWGFTSRAENGGMRIWRYK